MENNSKTTVLNLKIYRICTVRSILTNFFCQQLKECSFPFIFCELKETSSSAEIRANLSIFTSPYIIGQHI